MTEYAIPETFEDDQCRQQTCIWIENLLDPIKRYEALSKLVSIRDSEPDLALFLSHSFGTLAVFLQEIMGIYQFLTPLTFTTVQSEKICNIMSLLQCIAMHPETRISLLNYRIMEYVYPFLRNTESPELENLRLTSLAVFASLARSDNSQIIKFLLAGEMVPTCLRILRNGTELCRVTATFILQKIILTDEGLLCLTRTHEKFTELASALQKLVTDLVTNPSERLLKLVILCYVRLTDDPTVRNALRECLPSQLRDRTFTAILNHNSHMMSFLNLLLTNLNSDSVDNASMSEMNAANES